MFLEISGTPLGTLHNKNALEIASITDRAPPLIGTTFKPLNLTTPLYDENDIHVANITSILTTGASASSRHHKCRVNISQFANLLELKPNDLVCKAVPEPTSTLSLLALGTLGAASALKRKQK